MNINFSPIQADYITELMNLAMGLAANSMSEMIKDEVHLSVPMVNFVSRKEVIDQFSSQVSGNLSGVSQKVSGVINGELLLLFPSDKSLLVVETMMQGSVSLDGLAELEQEALCEIGNIILNAVVSSLADNLGENYKSSLPTFIQGNCNNIMPGKSFNNEVLLFLQVDFFFAKTSVNGYLVILLDVEAVDELLKKIDEHIVKLG